MLPKSIQNRGSLRRYWLSYPTLCFIFLLVPARTLSLNWKNLAPGIEYTCLHPISQKNYGTLHAFRINLNRYRLSLVPEKKGKIAGDVRHWVEAKGALIGVNGGFFDKDLRPLGLRLSNYQISRHLKAVSWWGVFFTEGKQAAITSQRYYESRPTTDFAIQSGPRLVINGHIPRLKKGKANRTAIGITREGEIILLATEHLPLSTRQLAIIMRDSEKRNGLNCRDAINLDGGTSTQLYAHINYFKVNVSGMKTIADAILVLPRKNHSLLK